MPATTVSIPTRMLVLGMAHEDGTIVVEEVIPVAAACGLTSDQVRSCLRRLVAEGLFEREGSGRGSVLRATERGMGELGLSIERTRLAYAQDAAGRGWDRNWRLVAFAVPERERAARDALRDRLLHLGGASLQGGLYLSPHPWQKDVAAAASDLGIGEYVTYASTDDLSYGGETDPRTIAAALWPLDDLARRYAAFLERYDGLPDRLSHLRDRHRRLPDEAFLPAALAMAVAFNECSRDDPLLPPELLPRPWPGRRAREVLIRSRRMALSLRQGSGRPALFQATFDEAVDAFG